MHLFGDSPIHNTTNCLYTNHPTHAYFKAFLGDAQLNNNLFWNSLEATEVLLISFIIRPLLVTSLEKQHTCNHNLIKTGRAGFSGKWGDYMRTEGVITIVNKLTNLSFLPKNNHVHIKRFF